MAGIKLTWIKVLVVCDSHCVALPHLFSTCPGAKIAGAFFVSHSPNSNFTV